MPSPRTTGLGCMLYDNEIIILDEVSREEKKLPYSLTVRLYRIRMLHPTSKLRLSTFKSISRNCKFSF